MRRAIHETVRRIGVLVGADLEREGILVGGPAGEFWLQLFAEVGTHVEVGYTRAAAEPLQYPATNEIGIQRLRVNRYGSQGLESIENDIGTHLMGLFDDRFRVIYESAAEDDV